MARERVVAAPWRARPPIPNGSFPRRPSVGSTFTCASGREDGWPGRGDLNARPPAPKAVFAVALETACFQLLRFQGDGERLLRRVEVRGIWRVPAATFSSTAVQ